MYGALAGSDFESTGVSNTAGVGAGLAPDDPRRVALRDTLCAGFNAGLGGGGDPHKASALSRGRRAAVDALIRLALVVTSGVVA